MMAPHFILKIESVKRVGLHYKRFRKIGRSTMRPKVECQLIQEAYRLNRANKMLAPVIDDAH